MSRLTADKMLHLFGGNMAAYGADEGYAVREPVTDRLMLEHLEGDTGIGIYPMWEQDGEWWVKWGCCDIDTGNWTEAYSLATALRAMGFTPFVERSRSKGWHIWVFSQGPVQASQMRRMLKVAYAAINLPAREANPKAEKLHTGQLGNYVRLPFKGALWEPTERQTMMKNWDINSDGEPMSADFFFHWFQNKHRANIADIHSWASRWVEPQRKTLPSDRMSDEEIQRLFQHMPNDLFQFIADGPARGGDRSEALVALAWKLKRAGFSGKEIYAAVCAADARWGKYHDRPDGEVYLTEIVERVL